ncbi:MAG: hypothetical protein OJF50_002038 [Nitrospira sp.]|nr:hypothetical protein [Nitrospira sp.]
MFYVAQAMLLTREVRRSKHSGVIAAFHEQFVKPGEVADRFFHLLRDGFEDRAEAIIALPKSAANRRTQGSKQPDNSSRKWYDALSLCRDNRMPSWMNEERRRRQRFGPSCYSRPEAICDDGPQSLRV